MSEIEFQPRFKERVLQKYSSKDWLDFEEPQILFFQGMRGSGKSALVNHASERFFNEGFLVIHIWSARSLENLYYSINKDCKTNYARLKIIVNAFYDNTHQGNHRARCASKGLFGDEYKKFLQTAIDSNLVEDAGGKKFKLTGEGIKLHRNELLHCNCNKSYPILLAVPDYVEFNEIQLLKFNGAYWKDFDEYQQHNSEITTQDKQLLLDGKLLKPEYLRPKPLIKIRQFTTPTSTDRRKKFRDEFTQIILDARNEHRFIVMNPSIFEGEMDKFDTIAEIFKMMPYLKTRSGHFKPLTVKDVGKPRKYWSKKQRSWHKFVIVINEIRSVAPSSNLHADKEAGKSKRQIFGYIPEDRHFGWFMADYQDPEDLYSGIKKQGSLTIIRRGSRNILGENFSWLFTKVEYDRIGLAKRVWTKLKHIEKIEQLKAYESKYPDLYKYLNQRRPYVDELLDNQAYVTWHNQEIKLITTKLPNFHHKQSTEDFLVDSNLSWTINKDKKPDEKVTLSKKEQKVATQNKKTVKGDIMNRIMQMRDVEKKSWDNIKEELVALQDAGVIPPMDFENKSPVYFSNWYGAYKKTQA